MPTITSIHALEILDSRGTPTLQVTLQASDGSIGKAAVPSGASTGEHEAVELRDGDVTRYNGKGVLKAVSHVNGPLAKLLIHHPLDQRAIDTLLIQADGTPNKSHFGANALLGISLAASRAAAASAHQPLYRYLATTTPTLPHPMMKIINGGVHADNGLAFQEFMIRPKATTFREALRYGVEVFQILKTLLKKKGYSTAVGDEGGFAPPLASHEEALDLITEAIHLSRHHVTIALDPAASEFYKNSLYLNRTTAEQIAYLKTLTTHYAIDSIEDGLDQNDWSGWQELTATLGSKIQIVGDDLFVTNPTFLRRGIKSHAANAILIKPNQIGTLTETLDTIALAKQHHYGVIISHRSGETEDTFIADLAVATSAGQIKTGSLSRSDRLAKYNRLLEIEESLL